MHDHCVGKEKTEIMQYNPEMTMAMAQSLWGLCFELLYDTYSARNEEAN